MQKAAGRTSKAAESEARIQEVTCKPYGSDPQLDAWADTLLSQADAFVRNKQPDPLDGFLVTHWR